ncbi:hypothetical protein PSN45_004319 [Yamadazyma tenuis]|nr:hypothetical protein PSN45_004319 [Yamadazyma tenuis]
MSSLEDLSRVTNIALISSADQLKNQAVSSDNGLLLDESNYSMDQIGEYSSSPQTLTLESASDSILSSAADTTSSSAASSSSGNSGSLEDNSAAATLDMVTVKLYVILGSLMFATAVVGSV